MLTTLDLLTNDTRFTTADALKHMEDCLFEDFAGRGVRAFMQPNIVLEFSSGHRSNAQISDFISHHDFEINSLAIYMEPEIALSLKEAVSQDQSEDYLFNRQELTEMSKLENDCSKLSSIVAISKIPASEIDADYFIG